jgi:hypothetical protein
MRGRNVATLQNFALMRIKSQLKQSRMELGIDCHIDSHQALAIRLGAQTA